MPSYLDYHGLQTFKGELDEIFATKLDADKKGVANGVAGLDSTGKVPLAQLPTTEEQIAAINTAGATQVAAVQAKGEETLESIPEDYTNLSNDVTDLMSAITLQEENIPGTTQTIVFDSSGNVSTITHSANGTAVRTDSFTFGTDTITEVRTLSTGETLTIVTNTDTLVTTVTYTAA